MELASIDAFGTKQMRYVSLVCAVIGNVMLVGRCSCQLWCHQQVSTLQE
ncbi:MAG: hypothetical protein AAF921_25990 [Cyanobacteria bacterium P01_D01_bin.44]